MDEQLLNDYELEAGGTFIDSLTGLANHAVFHMILNRELDRFKRYAHPLTIALIDIDWFAFFNKRHGYASGDGVLKKVSDTILKSIRKVDLAARYSGDRFAVMLTHLNADVAGNAMERIRRAVEKSFQGQITVSAGLASCPQDATGSDNLIRKAEKALQEAKLRGKNRIYSFRPSAEPMETKRDAPCILIVDDSKVNLKMLESLLLPLNYQVISATSGREALHRLEKCDIDLVLLDVMMPEMDGFEVCKRIKADPGTRMTPVILVTALDDKESRIKGIRAGAEDFLIKPPNPEELLTRTQSLVQMKRLNKNLTSIENVLFSLAKTVEAKDEYTNGHAERVANFARGVGQKLELGETDINALWFGGILHDIGKIGTPNELINKPGALDSDEWTLMQKHPDMGYQICFPLKDTLGAALDVIRHHHEKLDGSGYPDGLSGDDISTVARIMAVADIYDALTSDRSYRKGLNREKAFAILKDEANAGKLDAAIVDQLISMVRNGAFSACDNR